MNISPPTRQKSQTNKAFCLSKIKEIIIREATDSLHHAALAPLATLMNRKTLTLFSAMTAFVLVASGLLMQQCHGRTTEPPPLSPDVIQASTSLWTLRLPDVQGRPQALQQWQGKLVVLNLWATWCLPCRTEMPGFSRLQGKFAPRGVQFVGVALDMPEQVIDYANRTAISYPLLLGDSSLLPLFSRLGNPHGNVPYTLIFGRDGRLLKTHMGYWPESDLEKMLVALNTEERRVN